MIATVQTTRARTVLRVTRDEQEPASNPRREYLREYAAARDSIWPLPSLWPATAEMAFSM